MDNKDKIRYLRQYRCVGEELERLSEEIAFWRSRAEKLGSISHSPDDTLMKERIRSSCEQILRLNSELSKGAGRASEQRFIIERAIFSVSDPRERLLLRGRYIYGLTWEALAEQMGLERRWCQRLHDRALSSLKLEEALVSSSPEELSSPQC